MGNFTAMQRAGVCIQRNGKAVDSLGRAVLSQKPIQPLCPVHTAALHTTTVFRDAGSLEQQTAATPTPITVLKETTITEAVEAATPAAAPVEVEAAAAPVEAEAVAAPVEAEPAVAPIEEAAFVAEPVEVETKPVTEVPEPAPVHAAEAAAAPVEAEVAAAAPVEVE